MKPFQPKQNMRQAPRSTRCMQLAALTLPLLVTLGACSSNGTTTATSSPVSGATRVSQGLLADTPMLTVNGTSYSTDSTQFTDNGVPTSRAALSAGMQVTVLSNGTSAVSVKYDENVRGPIDSVNLDGTSSVLGQTITVSPDTVYELPGGHTLASGDVVEISGLRTADGSIAATWIRLENSDEDAYEVEGVIRALDAVANTFMIGGLTVDFGSVMLEGFGVSELADGDIVEVTDAALAYEPGSLTLIATDIEQQSPEGASNSNDDSTEDPEDQNEVEQDDQDEQTDGDYELEALITAIDGIGGFTVGNLPVRVSGTTVFKNGDASSIVLDTLVDVEGILAADGVLDATEIELVL